MHARSIRSLMTRAAAIVAVALLASCIPASTLDRSTPVEGEWRGTGRHVDVAGHIGALTRGSIFQAWLLQPGLMESGVVSAVGSYEVAAYVLETGDQIAGIELETSLSQHFGYQDHTEATFGLVARWHAFVFEEQVLLSASVSQGISYATAVPRFEDERWRNATRFLSHNSYELTLADPQRPAVAFVFRLHHRSGVWGLFGDVEEGSNVALMGLRYRLEIE